MGRPDPFPSIAIERDGAVLSDMHISIFFLRNGLDYIKT